MLAAISAMAKTKAFVFMVLPLKLFAETHQVSHRSK
jgi:hypothetical protein